VTGNGDGDGKIIHRAFLLNDLAKFDRIFVTMLYLLASPYKPPPASLSTVNDLEEFEK
jgi:hypothetical protein